jgi:hypothetical protein
MATKTWQKTELLSPQQFTIVSGGLATWDVDNDITVESTVANGDLVVRSNIPIVDYQWLEMDVQTLDVVITPDPVVNWYRDMDSFPTSGPRMKVDSTLGPVFPNSIFTLKFPYIGEVEGFRLSGIYGRFKIHSIRAIRRAVDVILQNDITHVTGTFPGFMYDPVQGVWNGAFAPSITIPCVITFNLPPGSFAYVKIETPEGFPLLGTSFGVLPVFATANLIEFYFASDDISPKNLIFTTGENIAHFKVTLRYAGFPAPVSAFGNGSTIGSSNNLVPPLIPVPTTDTLRQELADATNVVSNTELIGYRAKNTGGFIANTTARTLGDRFKDFSVDVMDFLTPVQRANARAFTYADDLSIPIQAALDYAGTLATGGEVFFPNAGYGIGIANRTLNYLLLRWPDKVSIRGESKAATIKVLNGCRGVGLGVAVLYNTTGLTNATLSDITIDFNGQNNLTLGGYGVTGNINRCGSQGGATDVVVERVAFKNSGGAHFLMFTGGGNDVSISHCTFKEFGSAIAGNLVADHSCIYLDVEDGEISFNYFSNVATDEVGTVLESHKGNLTIFGNRGKNFCKVYNMGGDISDVSHVEFVGNQFKNVREGLWVYTAAAWALSNVTIRHNKIQLREHNGVTYPSAFGIRADNAINLSTANIKHFSIEDNDISWMTTAQLAVVAVGMTINRVDDLVISRNKLHDIVGEAMILASEATPRSINRVAIIGNKIKDVAITSVAGNKRALAFNSINAANQKISDIDIRDNQIILTASNGTVANYGLQFNGGSFPETKIRGNTIKGAALSPINKVAVIATDVFLVEGEGAIDPFGNIPATIGSTWVDTTTPATPRYYIAGLVGYSGDLYPWLSQQWLTAVPVTGTYRRGDTVWNGQPAVGQPQGWKCTAGGTLPGTGTFVALPNL